MSAGMITGRTGAPLPATVPALVADGDARILDAMLRFEASTVVITPRGRLLRSTDLGHRWSGANGLDAMLRCAVCGAVWPCPSARMVADAERGDES